MAAAEQWSRVKEIVGAALEEEPGVRAAFLDRVCSENESLRCEVDSLLAAYSQADDLTAHDWVISLTNAVATGKAIGPYRLEKELGSGGMGQVWLAAQTQPVQRWVALKLIRAGFYDSSVAQRFLTERQALALMNHPAIAKVFDAGTTESGQPYFVMEYVEGLPITDYCDQNRLSVIERLKLFLQVCEGVQHAHQKAIIHRDLKPSNILVVEVDGKPSPRIIDFGLAKNAKPLSAECASLTQAGAFLGTPGYISPEQADPRVEDLDTRTDVYSLGVVLFELLTGCLPFDPQRWKMQRPDQVLKELCETDPPRPSTKAASSKAKGADARQLAKFLQGDLDLITLKALERDRDRRYGSTAELSADIGNYLENRPVNARSPKTAYRLQKYIRRNRLGVAIAASALLLLIAFAVTQSIQLRNIKRERDRGDRITTFMTRMFKVSDPSEARGTSVTAREILDRSSKEIHGELARDPELQAQLMEVMGRVYLNLGLASRARPLFESAIELRRRVLGPNDPKTLQSMDDLALLLDEEGHPLEAEKVQRESLAKRRAIQGPDHPDVRKALSNLAIFVKDAGRFEEAEKLDREILTVFLRTQGLKHIDTLSSMNNLASDYMAEGRYPEAKTLFEQALQTERGFLGINHPLTLASMNNIAAVLLRMGRYPEAEKLQEETRDIQRRVLGPDHPDTAGSTYNLACLAAQQGRPDKAFTLLREALDGGLSPNEALAIKDDTDLKALRGDPRFQAIIAYAKQHVAGNGKP
jgi:eukaryotic-like serine/threonine-protein kinase